MQKMSWVRRGEKRLLAMVMALVLGAPSLLVAQTDEDDDILLYIPPIVASAAIPLKSVKQLHGRWYFRTPSTVSDYVFNDYYRFDQATARKTSNPDVALIDGSSSLYADFSGPEWCDGGMVGSYNRQYREYLVLCNWGYPDTDLGDAYFFSSLEGVFPTAHYFYLPSTGELSTGTPQSGTGRKLSNAYRNTANAGEVLSHDVAKQQRLADYEARVVKQGSLQRSANDADARRQVWLETVLGAQQDQ